MRCYVDASAAMKLVVVEKESSAVRQWLRDLTGTVFSSILLETEVRRATLANGASPGAATALLGRVEMVEAPRSLFAEAGFLPIPGLRSLDALHLATAIREEAEVLLTYDRRLMDAAAIVGVPTVSPT